MTPNPLPRKGYAAKFNKIHLQLQGLSGILNYMQGKKLHFEVVRICHWMPLNR